MGDKPHASTANRRTAISNRGPPAISHNMLPGASLTSPHSCRPRYPGSSPSADSPQLALPARSSAQLLAAGPCSRDSERSSPGCQRRALRTRPRRRLFLRHLRTFQFGFDNWNDDPPAMTIVDPDTRNPVPGSLWPQYQSYWHQAGWVNGSGIALPIALLCSCRIREYHTHQSHIGDNIGGIGQLKFLCCRSSVHSFTGPSVSPWQRKNPDPLVSGQPTRAERHHGGERSGKRAVQ
jgi:hypothetical protein